VPVDGHRRIVGGDKLAGGGDLGRCHVLIVLRHDLHANSILVRKPWRDAAKLIVRAHVRRARAGEAVDRPVAIHEVLRAEPALPQRLLQGLERGAARVMKDKALRGIDRHRRLRGRRRRCRRRDGGRRLRSRGRRRDGRHWRGGRHGLFAGERGRWIAHHRRGRRRGWRRGDEFRSGRRRWRRCHDWRRRGRRQRWGGEFRSRWRRRRHRVIERLPLRVVAPSRLRHLAGQELQLLKWHLTLGRRLDDTRRQHVATADGVRDPTRADRGRRPLGCRLHELPRLRDQRLLLLRQQGNAGGLLRACPPGDIGALEVGADRLLLLLRQREFRTERWQTGLPAARAGHVIHRARRRRHQRPHEVARRCHRRVVAR
jgi:hypothetical protein